jgi:DNA-directed RNA polymerase specialized sigma24 family protein
MDSKNLWAKVVVAAYRGIPLIVEAIERFIDDSASQSGGCNCIAAFDGITEKMSRKERLLNLKCIADAAVSSLDRAAARIIKSRIKGTSFEDIADGLGLSVRALYRHYDAALTSMTKHMRVKGFDDEWFSEYFGDERYITGIVKRFKA